MYLKRGGIRMKNPFTKTKWITWNEYTTRMCITDHIRFISDTAKQSIKNLLRREA